MAREGLPAEEHSIFDQITIKEIYQEVQDVYLRTGLPWVIGYSGGKDSTAVVQLVWIALTQLSQEQLQWPVYVIASDTLVETPVVVDHIHGALRKINEAAVEQSLPFEAHKVVPKTTDTFWSNLIGRGYPAPNQRFRWCTDRMKIKPAKNSSKRLQSTHLSSQRKSILPASNSRTIVWMKLQNGSRLCWRKCRIISPHF